MNVDDFLDRTYDRQKYNCAHFASEVWLALTGEDLRAQLLGVFVSGITRNFVRQFEELARPRDPCLVVMQWRQSSPHLGVYLRGRVLHIQRQGVEFQPLGVANRGFTSTRFVVCRNT